MKRFQSWTLLLALGLLIGGCQPAAPAPTPEGGTTEPGKETTSTTDSKTELEPSVELPAELKTAAAEYYGMTGSRESTFETNWGEDKKGEGTERVRILNVENGEARVDVVRAGELAQLGSETVVIRKDGIYTESVGRGELSKPALQLPSDVAPGKKWTSSFDLTIPDGTVVKATMNGEALAIEKIKLSDGKEYEALVIVNRYTMKSTPAEGAGSTVTGEAKSWLVKGLGMVKLDMPNPNEPNARMVMNLVLPKS
ncbi:MAG TPA: hypothetical protein PLB31_02900 [Fimbriimonadaceae bacterium]|nr:hypothetical protein [Armatimonadota bacterium]HRD31196.1 hypothetical protein [Fimbriimonadaceae bacterium]HRE94669.1 hypothetical protein [Fimbriimonadaceae bacterium]HRI73399.1 hypothetical protein [Fimbriimonadaceae bacterium]